MISSIFDVIMLHLLKTNWNDLCEKNDSISLNWACCSVFRIYFAFLSTTSRCFQCSKISELDKCDDYIICETIAYHFNNIDDIIGVKESSNAKTNVKSGHTHHNCSWNRNRHSDQGPSIDINILKMNSIVHAELKFRKWWTKFKNKKIKK